jgi:hypothetical protein
MANKGVGVKPQSLGELVSTLRPGEACLWCGGRLQSQTALRPVGRAVAGTSCEQTVPAVDEVVLYCPECGCEVHMGGTGGLTLSHRTLVAAA